ncbi:hypothetical protein ABZ820_33390 [Streptomyces diacarni]|uniref:hypothetical protein n=1 Tax=Streptomyces diacarni TaxID=2800381 RepID=UPI0033BFD4A6
MKNENIEVFNLGDDGEYWLVTGTTDAHSAEVAIRNNDRELGTYLDDEDQLKFKYHRDLVWRCGGILPSRWEDDELLTVPEHFERYGHEDKRVHPFSGFLVTL